MAARYVAGARIPSVVYCLPRVHRCLPRLPLAVEAGAARWWHLSLERWPHAMIRAHTGAIAEERGAGGVSPRMCAAAVDPKRK